VTRSRYALAAILYVVVIAYASTIVGVAGPNYVPIDPVEALQRLIHIHLVEHGSDQRSDWMGNVVMLVPLGFFMTGWLSPSGLASKPGAFVLSLGCILAIKYAQLFFPPRTVTLNYVIAQSLGAVIGIFLFAAMRSPLAAVRHSVGRLESLRAVLTIYTGLLILFMLMPLDFALSMDDLAVQFDKLSGTFIALNGEGRAFVVRLALTLTSVAETAPIGALLSLTGRGRLYVGRSAGFAAWLGFLAMVCVYALTCLVISGSASLPAVAFRTAGIALGAWFMHWLTRENPDRLRYDLGRLVPWAVPLYLLLLFAVNGLLSDIWTTPDAAASEFYELGLLPLFNYYIVTKAQAAKNIVGHVVMYAPIGVMVWLRVRRTGGKALSFVLASLLSAIVETGRFLRPGLVPDINAVPLAGIAASLGAAFMPLLWQMLSAVALGRTTTAVPPLPPDTTDPQIVSWRDRDINRRARRRDQSSAIGDIEHY
jgi:VanZ family protein